ncbi:MAG: hypothetical protein H6568_14790 [Lewinellaceae bacterium]|nr:hypothetical protein [Lewinellaceae bacterium]HRW76314.1 hypothetical protein [Saprospiraceae bacterium]
MLLIGFILSILAGFTPLHGNPAATGYSGTDQDVLTALTCSFDAPDSSAELRLALPVLPVGNILPLLLAEPELETGSSSTQNHGKSGILLTDRESNPLHLFPFATLHPTPGYPGRVTPPRFILHQAFLI